jgi:hypothetical protein
MKTFIKTKTSACICIALLNFGLTGCGGGSTEPDGDFYAVNLLQSIPSACVDNLGTERSDKVGLNLIAYYGTRQAGANLSVQGNGSCAQYAASNHTNWGVILTASQYHQIIIPAVK